METKTVVFTCNGCTRGRELVEAPDGIIDIVYHPWVCEMFQDEYSSWNKLCAYQPRPEPEPEPDS